MRGSETFHAGKRRGLRWGLVMDRKQSEEFFHALGSLFSDIGAFRGPHGAWLESSFLTNGWLFIQSHS